MNKYHFFLLTVLCFNVHRLTPAETEEPATQKEIDEAYNVIVQKLNTEPATHCEVWEYINRLSPEIVQKIYSRVIKDKEIQVIRLFIAHNEQPPFSMISEEDFNTFTKVSAQYFIDEYLLSAAFEQNLKRVELALKRHANPSAQIFNKRGPCIHSLDTPLICLIKSGNQEKINTHAILELLLKQKADPRISNEYGETPLHYARTYSFCKLLLENKANPNSENHRKETPFEKFLTILSVNDRPTVKLFIYHGGIIQKKLNSVAKKYVEDVQAEIKETNYQSLAMFLDTAENNSQIPKTRNPVNEVIQKMLKPESKNE